MGHIAEVNACQDVADWVHSDAHHGGRYLAGIRIVEEDASDHAVLLRDLSGIGLVHAVDGCVSARLPAAFQVRHKKLAAMAAGTKLRTFPCPCLPGAGAAEQASGP